MQKLWRAFSLCILVIFLIVMRIPGTFSQVVIGTESNLEITQETIQAQVSTPQEEITPTIAKQQTNSDRNQPKSKEQNFPVVLDGETLFYYSSLIKGIDAQRRAQEVSQKIQQVAKNFAIPLDSLKIVELEGVRLISSEEDTTEDTVFAVVEADARVVNRQLDELAEEYLQKVKDGIAQYREQRSVKRRVMGILVAVFDTLVFIVLLILLNKLMVRINRRIERWRETRFRTLRIQNFQLFSIDQQTSLLGGFFKLIYWVIVAVLVFLYLAALFHYFPLTRNWGEAILSTISDILVAFGKAIVSYLPNLFTIGLAVLIIHYLAHFLRLFFRAIEAGNISIPGFYQDWAKPTEKLVNVFFWALGLTIIFPLLPGANSPAFGGISLFIGALFTLGGASAIANLVGGFIIIYTRAFQIGDRVKLGDVTGDILEKTIVSTRIRTPKNEIITIPNANLITSNIQNFTTALRDINEPLILYTTVTIGYDVPWRTVHQVLIDSALASPLIVKEPAPFVLQTSLGDFSVSYELNAYTDRPSMIPKIYSQLHQNIQDKFNEAGIEIMSPQYSAVRDGNQNTIPEKYLPKNYTAPGFRVNPLGWIFNQPENPANQHKSIDDN